MFYLFPCPLRVPPVGAYCFTVSTTKTIKFRKFVSMSVCVLNGHIKWEENQRSISPLVCYSVLNFIPRLCVTWHLPLFAKKKSFLAFSFPTSCKSIISVITSQSIQIINTQSIVRILLFPCTCACVSLSMYSLHVVNLHIPLPCAYPMLWLPFFFRSNFILISLGVIKYTRLKTKPSWNSSSNF